MAGTQVAYSSHALALGMSTADFSGPMAAREAFLVLGGPFWRLEAPHKGDGGRHTLFQEATQGLGLGWKLSTALNDCMRHGETSEMWIRGCHKYTSKTAYSS